MAQGDHGHDHEHQHGTPPGPHLDKGRDDDGDDAARAAAGAGQLAEGRRPAHPDHAEAGQGHGHDHGNGHGGHEHHHDHHHDHHHPHAHAAADVPRIHRASAPRLVRTAVVTASDTRTEATDTSGRYLRETLEDRGHPVLHQAIVPDDPEQVLAAIAAAREAGAEVVIVSGGTGLSRRDSTFEAVDGLLDKHLPGFGELFRLLSFQEIGSAAMLSRATAGVTAEGLVLFAVPGSTGACKTALERLILPELGHLVQQATK